MAVTRMEFADAGSLAPFYNRLVADVPFCWSVSEDEFASGLVWESPDHSMCDRLSQQRLLVSRRGDEVLGFAHTALETRDDATKGIIRFLGYAAGKRAAGHDLLLTAERRLRDVGARQALAFAHDYTYPFYHLAFGYLSDRLGHVQGLLGMNGYEIAPEAPRPDGKGYSRREEVFFDWRDCDVPRPESPDAELTVVPELNDGAGLLPNARFHLRRGEDHVGVCDTYCVGHWARADEAQRMSFVTWLGIDDEWQGRGYGRFLLLTALHELRTLGYRRSTISTNLTNYRAMTFYANLGYEVAGNGHEFSKSLV